MSETTVWFGMHFPGPHKPYFVDLTFEFQPRRFWTLLCGLSTLFVDYEPGFAKTDLVYGYHTSSLPWGLILVTIGPIMWDWVAWTVGGCFGENWGGALLAPLEGCLLWYSLAINKLYWYLHLPAWLRSEHLAYGRIDLECKWNKW